MGRAQDPRVFESDSVRAATLGWSLLYPTPSSRPAIESSQLFLAAKIEAAHCVTFLPPHGFVPVGDGRFLDGDRVSVDALAGRYYTLSQVHAQRVGALNSFWLPRYELPTA